MLHKQLVGGAPDEPETSDWDAICATPGPRQLFEALFDELTPGLPASSPAAVSEEDAQRVHTIWFGQDTFGIRVTETESSETTAFPMRCAWETFGLPGMKIVWNYSLEHAGQLGYVAFRHGALVCQFDSAADEQRFAAIWQRIIEKTPIFESIT